MIPRRIQRKREKGWRMPPNAVYVGRPTKWGNPYKVGAPHPIFGDAMDADDAVAMYIFHLITSGLLMSIAELRGKDLICWCPLDRPCHADVLLKLANGGE